MGNAHKPAVARATVADGTVLTLEDQSFPLVRFVVALRTGAAYDGPGRAGAHRMMMEMLLRGTQRADRRAFNTELEELGSAVDASVGSELCFVRGVALKRHLAATFNLVTEAVLTPAFAPHEFERLVKESVDGLQSDRDDDDAVADYFLRRSLYAGHPMVASPAGEVEDLQRLSIDQVHHTYGEWARGNVLVAFAGAITPAEAQKLAEPLLGHLRAAHAALSPLPAWPQAKGTQIIVVDKPDRTQVQLRLGRLALDGRAPDIEPFWLGVTAFGGTFTSPFTRAVRDERGWSYVAHADFRRRGLFPAPVVLRSAPALEDAVDCLELELQLYRDLAQGKLDIQVVASAREYLLNRYPFEVATAFDMLGPSLSYEILGLPLSHLLEFPERLAGLDLAEVPKTVARHLHPQHVTALLVAPASTVVPLLQQRFGDAEIKVVDFREGLGLNNAA